MFCKGPGLAWLLDSATAGLLDDGLTAAGVSVILLGVTLLAGLAGVIFIGTVNMFILPTGSFLIIG